MVQGYTHLPQDLPRLFGLSLLLQAPYSVGVVCETRLIYEFPVFLWDHFGSVLEVYKEPRYPRGLRGDTT